MAALLVPWGAGGAATSSPGGTKPESHRLALTDVRWSDHLEATPAFTRVVLEFMSLGEDSRGQCAPRFTMRYRRYPDRLEIDLFDVAGLTPEFPWPPVDRSRVVTAVTVFPNLPEVAHARAVICLSRPSQYEIRMLPAPCRLVVDLRPAAKATAPATVWVVQVNAPWRGLASLASLGADPAWLSLLPDAAGGVAVEAGAFTDQAAAQRRAQELIARGVSATVVSRGAAELPAPQSAPQAAAAR